MIYDGLSLKFTRPANINRPVLSLICPVPCSVKLANLFFFSANQPYQKQQPITDPVTPPQGHKSASLPPCDRQKEEENWTLL